MHETICYNNCLLQSAFNTADCLFQRACHAVSKYVVVKRVAFLIVLHKQLLCLERAIHNTYLYKWRHSSVLKVCAVLMFPRNHDFVFLFFSVWAINGSRPSDVRSASPNRKATVDICHKGQV